MIVVKKYKNQKNIFLEIHDDVRRGYYKTVDFFPKLYVHINSTKCILKGEILNK